MTKQWQEAIKPKPAKEEITTADFKNAGWRDATPLIRIGAAQHALDEAIKDARNSGIRDMDIELGKNMKPDVWESFRGDIQIWYEIHCGEWAISMTVTSESPDVRVLKWFPEKFECAKHFETQMEAIEILESEDLPKSPVGRGGPMVELVQCTLTVKLLTVRGMPY